MTIPRTSATPLLLVILASGALGCATTSTGTSQTVWISSSPPGATATILPDDMQVVTPTEVSLARKRSHTVRLQLDGYRLAIVYIDPVPGEVMEQNLLLGGPIGILVDIASGAAWMLSPEVLHVELEPLTARDESPEPTLE